MTEVTPFEQDWPPAAKDAIVKLEKEVADLRHEIADHECEHDFCYDADGAGDRPDLVAALHMFHDQYHESGAWRLCTQEPCRDITARLDSIGPAPLTLVGAG